jgi:hypothetical protein
MQRGNRSVIAVGRVTSCAPGDGGTRRRARSDAPYPPPLRHYTKGKQRRRAQSPVLCLKPPSRKSPRRPMCHYWATRTWRCVPGNHVCSGRAGGAGCQSKALSTIWCIWWNHQRAVKGDEERYVRSDWVTREAPRLSSNCVSVMFYLSVFAPSLGVWVGQIRSNPYKYGYRGFGRLGSGGAANLARSPSQGWRREFRSNRSVKARVGRVEAGRASHSLRADQLQCTTARTE